MSYGETKNNRLKGYFPHRRINGVRLSRYLGCSSWKMPCSPRRTTPHNGSPRRSRGTRRRSACRLFLRRRSTRMSSHLLLPPRISSEAWWSCRRRREWGTTWHFGISAHHSAAITLPTGNLFLTFQTSRKLDQKTSVFTSEAIMGVKICSVAEQCHDDIKNIRPSYHHTATARE